MFFGKRSAGFGFSVRCRLEKADRAWILSVHKRIDEALIQEEVLSYRFGIPQVCFEEHSPGYKKNIIEGVFGGMDLALLLDRVMMCLDEYGRSISFPFYEKRTWTQHGRRKSHECYSCNIIEGICTIPKVTGRKHEWVPVENNSWEMVVEKPVYSLDVDKHHTYIVNGGLVTCNSIYEFRGAVPRYLVDHSGEFDIYRLEANYRSMPEIVKAANRLIENNQDRITKTMRATREAPALAPESVQVENNIQSEGIVARANSWHCKEAPVAILARKHSLLGKIDRLMEEAGIPHTYIGKTTALTNSEPFRRFHAFLKLAVNPFDNMSFLLIRDIIGLSREEYGRIRLSAAQTGRSHFQVLIERYALVSTEDLNITRLENTPLITGGSLSQCAEWLNEHHPDLSPESMAFIQKWLEDHPNDIASYLDWLATFDVQDEIKGEEAEGITLATIHAAKGLEWPIVIVAGCNEGIIPARPNDMDEIEGERRLFYTAMTRAMDQLMLTVRPTESTDGAGRVHKSPESRFIMELQGDR
jgi:ATP-dependent exoDNAse (exonuclease V) beta subunit